MRNSSRRLLWRLAGLTAGLLAAGYAFQRIGLAGDRRRFPPVGCFLPTPAGTFHWVQSGTAVPPGLPSVLLESGLAGTSLSWTYVQTELARSVQVASYDRLGFGWSSPSHSRRTIPALVSELFDALAASQLPAPYILVGHSYGGLIVRAFTQRYPELVQALVLVDPVSTRHWAACDGADAERLRRGIRFSRRGALLARFGLIRLLLFLVVLGRSFLPKTVAALSAPGAGSTLTRLVREIRKLPEPLWPIVRAQWCRPVGFETLHAYFSELQSNCHAAETALGPLTLPATILSASTATPRELAERDSWIRGHPGSRHRLVPESGHWIQVEHPETVLSAIQSMLPAGNLETAREIRPLF